MAKQIEGVSERILACAKAEFLDKGYTDASLRVIAAAAKTSTNSIYVRFGDKEGLFSAIVEPVLTEMTERFVKIQESFHQMDRAAQAAHMAGETPSATWESMYSKARIFSRCRRAFSSLSISSGRVARWA